MQLGASEWTMDYNCMIQDKLENFPGLENVPGL